MNVGILPLTNHKSKMPSIAVQMVQANGSRSANVPLSSSRPTILSNSSSPGNCHIALPKSSVKQKVSLEPVSGSSRALFRDCLNPQSSPKVLSVNDEFVMAGKTFRVVSMAEGENEERFASTPTMAQSKLQQRKATPFVAHHSKGVAFHRDVSSPAVPKMQHRPKATPFVSSSNRVQFFDGNSPVSTLAPQFKLQGASPSSTAVAVAAAPLPKSVLKFMASRAGKASATATAPVVTRGAPVVAKPRPVVVVAAPAAPAMRLAPTPLRVQIQQEGQRLNVLRSQLLDRMEEFGLDVSRYQMWTVYQLEQRVEALEMELQRASVEALLVEAGYDPREFEQYDADEIEQWLEEEISALEDDDEEEELQPQRVAATAYRGKITEFASPAPAAPRSFVQNSPAVPEPSFVTNHHSAVYEEQPAFLESSELDGSASFIFQEQQAKASMFDEEESLLSPIAKRPSTSAQTPFSVKKLVSTPYFKRVAAEEMTCEKIRAELKSRGLKVGGLKSVIVERLADALEDEARDQGLEVMEVTGHDYLGREVVRVFELSGESHGVVEAWAPPPVGQVDESLAKFRVVHDNGEVELLSLDEVEQALV